EMSRHGLWVGIAVVALTSGAARGAGPSPTYHKDVERIVQKQCQDCHRPGEVAPFALLTYEQAKKHAADLASVTESRTMPPWPASPTVGGPFLDARRLSDA